MSHAGAEQGWKRSQCPGDGVRGGLHAGHEEDAELAPHAREGQRGARLAVQVHQVIAYRGVLREVPRPPACSPDTSAGVASMPAEVTEWSNSFCSVSRSYLV